MRHLVYIINLKTLFRVEDGLEMKYLVLDVNAFERLLGPCKELMSRKIDQYDEEIANLNTE